MAIHFSGVYEFRKAKNFRSMYNTAYIGKYNYRIAKGIQRLQVEI
jgi:hypothetical protein